MNKRKPSHILPNNSDYHSMMSPSTSPPCFALGKEGRGAARDGFAKNNHDLPMMPSTPHSHPSSALLSSAIVTPRPTPSRDSVRLVVNDHAAMPSPPVITTTRTSADLDAANLLASVASIASHELVMTDAVHDNHESLRVSDKDTPSPGLIKSRRDDKEVKEEAPPSPRLTYLCSVFDREDDPAPLHDLHALHARTVHAPLQSPGHLPKFSSLQRGIPIMSPLPPPPPPPMMMMGSSEQDASGFRTRTISVDTADSYLAPDLAYLRNSYESGKVRGVPSTFVSVPTIISPPSSPTSGPRPTGPNAISGVRSLGKQNSPKEQRMDDDFYEEDEDDDECVDAGADNNNDDDEEYLPAAKRSRKKLKISRSTKAASVATSGGSRAVTARTSRKGMYISASNLLGNHKGIIQPTKSLKPQCDRVGSNPKFRIVLREKFSWKLYPEVSI